MFRNALIIGLASSAAAFAPSGVQLNLRSTAPRAACGLQMQTSAQGTDKLTSALFAKLDIDGSGSIDASELKTACLDGHLELTMACLDGYLQPDNVKLLSGPKKRSRRVDMDGLGS
jgi:hypothetical protein